MKQRKGIWRRLPIIAAAAMTITVIACRSNTAKGIAPAGTKPYFTGKFAYMADAAVFKDCATGMTFSVPMRGAFIDAERKYSSLAPGMGEFVFTEVTGKVIKNDLEGGEGHPYALRIDSLISMDRHKDCIDINPLPGVYECREDGYLATLRLTGNYEATLTRYNENGKEETVKADWMQSPEKEFMLVYYKGDTVSYISIYYDGKENLSMSADGKSKLKTFKRIYLQ